MALPLIHFVSRSSYNLFHSFADGASIVIAASTFTIIWNSRHRVNNDYFLFMGIAFLSFSFLDAMHLLGNKNMGVFPAYGNLGPTFYIASRYLLSVSLLCAPLFIHRRLKAPVVLGAYALVCALVVLTVFYWKVFPVCIVEGVGLTPFKVVSDYVICLILAGSIVLLLRHRESFDPRVLRIIVASIVLSIATGLTFTLYTDPFGITNMVGHLFQLASFYMVYIAFIQTSLTKPHEILFLELKQNEEKLIQNLRKLDNANIELNQEITERKQAQLELERMRNLLAEGEKIAQMGTFEYIAETQTTVWSEQEYRIYGLDPAEPSPAYDVMLEKCIHPDFAAPLHQTFTAAIQNNSVYEFEHMIVRPDGSERWVHDRAIPYFEENGKLIRYIGATLDITERKQAEEALRVANERFAISFAANPAGIALSRLRDGLVLDVNETWLTMFGYSREEIIGKPVSSISFWPMPEERACAVAELLEQGFYRSREQRMLTKSGESVMTLGSADILTIAGEEVILSTWLDITERKAAEEALRESEAKYRRLFENIQEMVTVYEVERNERGQIAERKLREANPAFLRAAGVSSIDEIMGKTSCEIFGKSWSEDQLAAVQHAMDTGEVCMQEVHRPESDRYYNTIIVPLDKNTYLGTGWDITERKKMEEDLRKSRDKLEFRVEERTAELRISNKALMDHALKLERLNEELQEFAFVAAHDLQEPLRKIQTFGHMLAREFQENLGEKGQDYLIRMVRSAERMSDLLRSLLDYSRIASRPSPFEPVSLTELANNAASDLELVIRKTGATVEIGDLPIIDADAAQIRQLLQNLLANSMKYCKDCEKPVVRIYCDKSETLCTIYVEDKGIGFEEKFVDRIFRPFQRLHGRGEGYEGTGMGLAICRKIVERHQGSITAKSTPGQGSTFIVQIPVKQRETE